MAQPPDATEICAAGECSAAGDLAGLSTFTSAAAVSVPIERLGYRPRRYPRMSGFDHETTINYLSPDQILVTFDSHRLRSRHGDPWPVVEHRTVRAVLLNGKTGAVERVLEWVVDGTGQYLWPAGPGRVLVHIGGTLREFGPDLKLERSLPAPGDLLWVAMSPSGHQIALGLLHERHTQEVHERIANLSSLRPEEDVELRLYDRNGRLVLTGPSTSETLAPVLTEAGGELTVQRDGGQWRIEEQTHETRHTVATVRSTCAPNVSSTSPTMLFVQGCVRRVDAGTACSA